LLLTHHNRWQKQIDEEETERKAALLLEKKAKDKDAPFDESKWAPKLPEGWVKLRNPERYVPVMHMAPPPRSGKKEFVVDPMDYAKGYKILHTNVRAPTYPY
jgi:hypothetical protein